LDKVTMEAVLPPNHALQRTAASHSRSNRPPRGRRRWAWVVRL